MSDYQISKSATEKLDIEDVVYPPEGPRRNIDHKTVKLLKESIGTIGLQYPIAVKAPPLGTDDEAWGKYYVVAGAHRLEALRQLGETSVPVVHITDPIELEMWEIDENLCRAELSPAEKSKSMRIRRGIWKRNNNGKTIPETPGRPKGFAADLAEKTGESKRNINKAISRTEKINPKAMDDLIGTSLDKGTELDALANLPVEEQKDLARKAKAGEGVKASAVPIEKTGGERRGYEKNIIQNYARKCRNIAVEIELLTADTHNVLLNKGHNLANLITAKSTLVARIGELIKAMKGTGLMSLSSHPITPQ